MIAFVLIAVSCAPVTGDLIREFRHLLPWATAPEGSRRRFLREAGMVALCYAALIELTLRFSFRS